jgi:hypothetical protein
MNRKLELFRKRNSSACRLEVEEKKGLSVNCRRRRGVLIVRMRAASPVETAGVQNTQTSGDLYTGGRPYPRKESKDGRLNSLWRHKAGQSARSAQVQEMVNRTFYNSRI